MTRFVGTSMTCWTAVVESLKRLLGQMKCEQRSQLSRSLFRVWGLIRLATERMDSGSYLQKPCTTLIVGVGHEIARNVDLAKYVFGINPNAVPLHDPLRGFALWIGREHSSIAEGNRGVVDWSSAWRTHHFSLWQRSLPNGFLLQESLWNIKIVVDCWR